VFAYLGINIETFVILMSFMCIDSILGGVKAVRLGDKFKFRTMLIGFTLKLCFLVIPLVVALLGKSLGYNFHSVVSITISILTVSEAYSILGNIYSIKNKKDMEKIDAISLLIKTLRSFFKDAIMVLLKKLENKK